MVHAAELKQKQQIDRWKSSPSFLLKISEEYPGDDREEFFISRYWEYSEHMFKALSPALLNSHLFYSNENGHFPRLNSLPLLFQLYSGE